MQGEPSFKIRAVKTNQLLSCAEADTKNGNKVTLTNNIASGLTRWKINQKNNYVIITNDSTNTALDNTAQKKINVQPHLWKIHNEPPQQWELILNPDGTYFIKSLHSEMVLAARDNNSVVQAKMDYSEDQKWIISGVNTFNLSLEISLYYLVINHKHINDIGKFAVFCMKGFRGGITLKEISEITNIDVTVIEKQLQFLIQQKYITENYELLEQGKYLLQIFDFISKNNDHFKPYVALEHYIEDPLLKPLFYVDDKFKAKSITGIDSAPEGSCLQPVIHYKVKAKLDEIQEVDKDRIFDLLIQIYPEDTDLISSFKSDENRDEFLFSLRLDSNGDDQEDGEKKKYYIHKKLDADYFSELLNDSPSAVRIQIPAGKFKSWIQDKSSAPGQSIQWFEDQKEKLNFCLNKFNGMILNEIQTYNGDKTDTTTILPCLIENSVLNREISIPQYILFDNLLKTSVSQEFIIKYLSEKELLKLIEALNEAG